MTLDKFGRHLLKRSKISTNSETITSSRYMFYNQILTFQSDKIISDKYLIVGDKESSYLFPLEAATIENVRINSDNIVLSINDKILETQNIPNYPLKLNDKISFHFNNNITSEQYPCLFAEIIIKCSVKFENMLVETETAYYKE